MPTITSTPPPDTKAELTRLRRQLSRDVPRKTDENLLVATWNIREFGGLTDKWRSESSDSPKRDLHSLACITEIVARFDVVAIQEAQRNLRALRHLLNALGESWTVILTDPTEDDDPYGHGPVRKICRRLRVSLKPTGPGDDFQPTGIRASRCEHAETWG